MKILVSSGGIIPRVRKAAKLGESRRNKSTIHEVAALAGVSATTVSRTLNDPSIVDPATARPARTPWRDVTVAAQHCVAADVAAKAALLLGREAPSWLDRLGLPGRFVDGRGAVQVNRSWRGAVAEAQAA